MNLLTTREVAALVGASVERVSQIARQRGVEPAKRLRARFYLWNPADVERLRPGPVGRPVVSENPRHRKK